MRSYFIGLVGLGLLGASPVLGQPPVPVPLPPPGVPAGAPVIVHEASACCPAHYTCVPEHYVKKTTKWVFNCGSEPLCLCYFHRLFGRCDCDGGRCERPYTRRYLVKKPRVCEKDDVKCVPVEGAPCDHGPCPVAVGCGPAMPPPPGVVPPGGVLIPATPPTAQPMPPAGLPMPSAGQRLPVNGRYGPGQ